ncbi:BIG3 [Scenedesmus sp. PABB004]|nr:BIG3 [Scenedesmus sp. PABB004]
MADGGAGEFAGASAGSAHSSRDKAFEIFVKRTITAIQKEAWGRSKEVKDIREACQAFLNTLDRQGCTEETLKQVLYPLQLACSCSTVKVAELALGCLHKLVAHAWLHGESTPGGTMDMLSAHGSLDDDDTVANVIKMVIKCGETSNEALQLAVVRALLTFTTAEHFIAHGECLLAAVRAVFNLALGGSDNPVNRRTAANALLQMLNTICKRVTQIQPRLTGGSECSSRTTSDALEIFRSTSGASFANASPKSQRGSGTGASGLGMLPPGGAGGSHHGGSSHHGSSHHGGPGGGVGGSGYLSTAAGQQQLLAYEIEAAAAAAAGSGGGGAHARAAQLAQLAERTDLQGLEAALEAAAAGAEGEEESDSSGPDETELAAAQAAAAATAATQAAAPAAPGTPSAASSGAGAGGEANGGDAAAAPAPLHHQSSVGPPAGALGVTAWHSWQQQGSAPPTPHAPATPHRHGRHNKLTTQDKDVLLVLTAFCKLASREAPGSSGDSVLAQGKLLALEMLAKARRNRRRRRRAGVLSSSHHSWDHVPEAFCRQLRQPLCLALLRNCGASDPVAFSLALRLLMAILCLPRLRLGLRAELGAFYPLLLLRCLEGAGGEPANVAAALGALTGLLSEPQLLVDLYVNFDCDLQASNLYERTVQVLAKLATPRDGDADGGARGDARRATAEGAASAAGVRREALGCCLQVIAALQSWAKPIREAALRAAEADAAPAAGQVRGVPPGAGRRKARSPRAAAPPATLPTPTPPLRAAPRRAAPPQPALSSLPSIERNGSSSSLSGLARSASARALAAPPAPAPPPSEAERLAAAKSTKEQLAKGVALFNAKGPLKGVELLMSQGLLEGSPPAVAAFLRLHHDALDKAQLGELLGHHEDFAVAVMHAWVDGEPSMAGQALDQSLRRLLGGFRLPGEAQKIDRIMEKFAERYCKDNPARFGNADAAYVLAFAIIMLNTDAHNPLAERRISKADFVAMNSAAGGDGGGGAPALPAGQLEEIFDRIVRDEILVRGETPNRDLASARTSTRNRLAAAMGWTALLQPFRALAGNGGGGAARGGKDNAQAHRRYLQEMAEREVVRAAASGNVWCSASHPEHVRPMLQAGGPMLLQALSAAFAAAPDGANAAPVLAGLLQLARLAGVLGLDSLCEGCVAALAERCGVFDPAPAGSAAEAKQLAALQALLGLTAGPEASFLGSGWVVVLRCISALDALKVRLSEAPRGAAPARRGACVVGRAARCRTRPPAHAPPPPPPPAASPQHELTRPAAVPAAPPSKDAAASNPFSRMFGSLFGAGGAPTSPAAGAGAGQAVGARVSLPGGDLGDSLGARDSLDGSKCLPLPIRDAPGAGLVAWAESAAGAAELERAYARSASLDGDAVVVFMRALCAVSQEELESGGGAPASPGGGAAAPITVATRALSPGAGGAGGPRLYSLQKVVECAYVNMPRIRLVWGKLWAVIAAQLVGASCHPHRRVALYAVDSLRQLVAKLLARAELEHFTHQEEALRPFVAVLRQCDEACVRELAVQCVMQAVSSHPAGLGSGWRMAVLALRLGASDGSPAVIAQAQEALGAVVATLFAGGGGGASPRAAGAAAGGSSGHALLRETVQAVVAGIRNPAHLELSISAVQLLGRCGEQLAAYEDAGGRDEPPPGAAAAAPGGVDLDGDYGWGLLLRSLADVLQHDRRPQVTDAALEMVFGLLALHSGRWDGAAWRVLVDRVLRHMLALPPGLGAPAPPGAGADGAPPLGAGSFSGFAAPGGGGAGGAVPAGMSAAEQGALVTTLLQRMDRYYPMLCQQAAAARPEFKEGLLDQLAAIGVAWYRQGSPYLSTAGIKALMHLADTLDRFAAAGSGGGASGDCGWALLLEPLRAAVAEDVALVLRLAAAGAAEAAEASAAAAAARAVEAAASAGRARRGSGGGGSPGGSPRAGAGGAAAFAVPLGARGGAAARAAAAAAASAAALGAQLRVRTQQLVLMQRALASVHARCRGSMTWEEQMALLEVLALGVDAAIAHNARLAGAGPEAAQQQQPLQQQQASQQQRVQQQPQAQAQQPAVPPALLLAVPEDAALATRAGSAGGSIGDSLDLASAVSRNSSLSMSGLVGFGSFLAPNPSCGGSAASGALGSADGGAGAGGGPGSPGAPSPGGEPGSAAGAGGGPGSDTPAPAPAPAPRLSGPDDASVVSPLSAAGIPDAPDGGDGAAAPPGWTAAGGGGGSNGAAQDQQQQAAASGVAPLPAQPGAQPALAPLRTQPPPSAGGGAGAAPGSPGSAGRARGGAAMPALLVSSPESTEEVRPALMRLEAEGGLLLIEALTLSLRLSAVDTPATERARQRLLSLVRAVICSEAACSAVPLGGAAGGERADASQDALAGAGWEHAARAPLVVAALRVLSGLTGAAFAAEVARLFPALCRLMCSSHRLTRLELHAVLTGAEFARLLPAARPGGGGAAVAVGAVAAGDGVEDLLL